MVAKTVYQVKLLPLDTEEIREGAHRCENRSSCYRLSRRRLSGVRWKKLEQVGFQAYTQRSAILIVPDPKCVKIAGKRGRSHRCVKEAMKER